MHTSSIQVEQVINWNSFRPLWEMAEWKIWIWESLACRQYLQTWARWTPLEHSVENPGKVLRHFSGGDSGWEVKMLTKRSEIEGWVRKKKKKQQQNLLLHHYNSEICMTLYVNFQFFSLIIYLTSCLRLGGPWSLGIVCACSHGLTVHKSALSRRWVRRKKKNN